MVFHWKYWTGIGVAVVAFAAAKWIALHEWHTPAASGQAHSVACDVAGQGCRFLGGAVFRLQKTGGHAAPLVLTASGVPATVRQISASFQMQGMDMGFNRFELADLGGGSWRAEKVYLPFCASGRHDWLVEWMADGQRFQAAFHM